MKSNYLLLLLMCSLLASSPSARSQIAAGVNNGGPASLESQTASPAGQTDFQTDLFTGRFGYTVPLDLAPARHDSTPNLELLYNSANGNSWCGVGWDLDLGYIERETKYGVPVQWSGGHAVLAYDDTKGFLMSFKNKMSDLVSIGNNGYRAQVQSDFLNFQFYTTSNSWVVTDKSGNRYIFGSGSGSQMVNAKSGWASGETGTFHWALDTIITATGDEATITYTAAGGRLYPQTYSYNGSTAGVSPLCVVHFYLTSTNRPDTTISCRSAYAVTNQYLLNGIAHLVNGQMVWSNRLNYTFSPSTGRALLSSITRYGTDQSSTLPPITFGYSQQSFTFQPQINWTNLWMPSGGATGDYYSFANAFCDLVDVDGDGFPDRVISPCTGLSTNWWIQHNNGSNGFGNPVVWNIGSQSYEGNSTSSDLTWSEVGGYHGRVIDINGDGLPDFVVDPLPPFVSSGATYTSHMVQLNNSTNLLGQIAWTNVNINSPNREGTTTAYEAVENLAEDSPQVEMLDMNGDGLPDRVMDEPNQPWNNYFVQFNTGSGYTGTNLFGPFTAQNQTDNEDFGGLTGNAGNGVSMRMLDINGDGLPDRVMIPCNADGPLPVADQTYLVVELNNGYGFEPDMNWTNVNPYIVSCEGGTTPGIEDLGDDRQVAYRDINGDGLPDRIIACQCSAYPYTNWWVQINTGTGFAPLMNWGPINSQNQTNNATLCGIASAVSGVGVTMLLDMNGDGLPDRVEIANSGTANYVVELSSGPFPDLLTIASNGLGGVVFATYKPSTQYDNRQSTNTSPSRYLLPFPLYTVSSMSVGDGIYPSNTTTYKYTGGYWNYGLHQFDGFAQTTVVDPSNMTNVHWFHQAGGRNNSSFGEYSDSTSTIGKVGMEFRTDTIGSDGNPYKTVLNQVDENFNSLQHFAYVATNIEIDYPATAGACKARAKAYYYNLSNGNLTNEMDWGQVTVTLPPSSEAFTDVGGDTVYHITQFASLSNTNIVDKPATNTLSLDSAGDDILRQEIFTYDGGSGSTLQERYLICPGSYRTNSYGYDSYYNKIRETNAADVVTQITYDSAFETFPTQITENGGYPTLTTYDPRSGELSSSTDPAGLVTANTYDVFLRLSEKEVSTTPNGSANDWLEKYTYTLGDSSGPQNSVLLQQSDGVDLVNGHETIAWFDGVGRTVQTRTEAETGQYRVVDTFYDKRGHVAFVSLPYFESGTSRGTPAGTLGTLHGYDPIGRPNQLTASEVPSYSGGLFTGASPSGGDGSSSPVGSSSFAYYYGTDPWTWVVTDEAGAVHRYTMDAYGHTNQVAEVNGSQTYTTTYGLNLAGDLQSVTDNANNVIQYSNNLMGEVVAMADPDMGVWQYQRDYAGRIREQTDGDGQTVHYNYSPDPLGRLLSRQVYDLKGQFYYGITNRYDTNSGDTTFPVYLGQLYQTIDSEGFTEYGYDVRGRKTITRRYLVKNGTIYTNQYTYDDMDRVVSTAYPNGGPLITYVYDTGANLSKVQQGGTTYYWASGFTALDQIATIDYANNSFSATYTYYPYSARLQKVVTGGVQSLAYTYDQVSDITLITDGIYHGTSATAGIQSGISYDGLHRLLGFTRDNGQAVTCTYDSVGDMLSYSENGSAAYTYNTTTTNGNHLPHAVKNANGLNYAYDLCGNMLVRGTESLVYNPENRLIASAVSNQATTFGYDADGHRLWKQGSPTNTLQVWIDGNYEEKDGKILYHVSAGDRPIYTYSSDGSVAEYYIPDHLHSAEIMVNASGSVVDQHYEYGAYGNSRYTSSTTAFPITRRYTSQYFDEETGLYCFGARYYDPVIGRFVQPDTIIPNVYDPQAYDRYAYARDNPLRYVDPTGHAWALFDKQAWGQFLHNSFIGDTGAHHVDPNSAQALGNAAGIGVTPLTDANGNVVSGGQAAIDIGKAVLSGPTQAAMMLGGEGEAKGAFEAGEEALQVGKAEETGTAIQNASQKTVTRYMGNEEAEIAKQTGEIPNVGRDRLPRPTHVTTDAPLNSASEAQKAYELPSTPTHRVTVPAERVGGLEPAPSGPTTSGGGSQNAVSKPIPVSPTEIIPLGN